MHENKTNLAFYYLVLDLLILNLAFVSILQWNLLPWSPPSISLSLFLSENLAWVITFFVIPKKNLYLRDGFSNRAWRITLRTIVYVLISIIVHQFTDVRSLPMSWWLLPVLVFYTFRLGVYFVLYYYLKTSRLKGRYVKNASIIGHDSHAKNLAATIKNNKVLGYEFVGYVSDSTTPYDLGAVNELDHLIDQHQIDVLFVVVSLKKSNRGLNKLIELAFQKGIRIKLLPVFEAYFELNSNSTQQIGAIRVIDPLELPLDSHFNRLLKRGFDLVFSTLVIVLLFSWLFPILAVIIKVSSKGPVFFKQERTGMNNKSFKCLKFRSMRLNKDADRLQSTVNDHRITKIGHFLRKTNLDEFPQFFNVWWGQMSVVGPRPHMLTHTDFYKDRVSFYKSRHFIKPGVTGWAQINGYRGVTDELWKMKKRVEYDLFYVRSYSFYLDIKIIISTVFDRNSYKNAG